MPMIARYVRLRIIPRSVFISVFLFLTLYGFYIFLFSTNQSKVLNLNKETPLLFSFNEIVATELWDESTELPKFHSIATRAKKVVIKKKLAKEQTSREANNETMSTFADSSEERKLILGALSLSEESTLSFEKFVNAIPSQEGLTSEMVQDGSILLYNRVPKCGSTALINLLGKLGNVNGFKHYSSRQFWKRHLDERGQKSFLNSVSSKDTPMSVDRHVYFINCTYFGLDNVYYINLIRDPVERIISDFHYLRAPKRWRTTTSTLPPQSWFKKNFSECVLKNDPECSFTTGSYLDMPIAYFCGHEEECMKLNSRWALQKAKENVDKYYTVVGILEDFESMTRVAEKLLPRFFNGSLEIFHNAELKQNKTPKKPKVPENVRNILKNKLKLEYDFYFFIKQRFQNQNRSLSL